MSAIEQEKAIQEGKIVLPTPAEFRSMKKEEISIWRAKVQPLGEEIRGNILNVFRSLPKSLILIFRYRYYYFENL
jgi:hypothetical protein